MKKIACLILTLTALASFTGCATGPQYSTVKNTIPALAPDKGRIYFYRASTFGAAIQPDVKLNGEVVGTAKCKGVFYVDRVPNSYMIETSTEVTRQLSITLEKGQTRYVRFGITFGFMVGHVYPELVDPAIGEKESLECNFTGGK